MDTTKKILDKKPYRKPQIREYGNISMITQGGTPMIMTFDSLAPGGTGDNARTVV